MQSVNLLKTITLKHVVLAKIYIYFIHGLNLYSASCKKKISYPVKNKKQVEK